jgi:hypothetical protein
MSGVQGSPGNGPGSRETFWALETMRAQRPACLGVDWMTHLPCEERRAQRPSQLGDELDVARGVVRRLRVVRVARLLRLAAEVVRVRVGVRVRGRGRGRGRFGLFGPSHRPVGEYESRPDVGGRCLVPFVLVSLVYLDLFVSSVIAVTRASLFPFWPFTASLGH